MDARKVTPRGCPSSGLGAEPHGLGLFAVYGRTVAQWKGHLRDEADLVAQPLRVERNQVHAIDQDLPQRTAHGGIGQCNADGARHAVGSRRMPARPGRRRNARGGR